MGSPPQTSYAGRVMYRTARAYSGPGRINFSPGVFNVTTGRAWALVLTVALWGLAAGYGAGPGLRTLQASAAGALRQYRVYFLDRSGARLVPVARTSGRALTPLEAAGAAFQALCNGPPPGLDSAVRRGCRVQRVWRSGQTLHLEMHPEDFDFVPGVPAANAWDDQVEMTAAQFPGIRRLQFWAAGRPRPGGPLPVDGRPNWLTVAGRGLPRVSGARTRPRAGTPGSAGAFPAATPRNAPWPGSPRRPPPAPAAAGAPGAGHRQAGAAAPPGCPGSA